MNHFLYLPSLLSFLRTLGIILIAIASSIALLALIITSTNSLIVLEKNEPIPTQILSGACLNIDDSELAQKLTNIPDCIIMEKDEEMTRFSFETKPYIPKYSLSSTIRTGFSGSFLTLRFADADESWKWMLKHIDEDQKIGITGQFGLWLQNNFGDDLSFNYEILPMLSKGPTTLHLGTSESGSLIFGIEGVMKNSKELSEYMEKIHLGFRSAVPATKIVRRNLEDRFDSLDIRSDPDAVSEELMEHEQWEISLLKSTGDPLKQLATAQRGSTYVISNDENALMDILKKDKEITPPTSSSLTKGYKLADGAIDKVALAEIIKGSAILEDLNLLPEKFTFSVEQMGEVSLITIE